MTIVVGAGLAGLAAAIELLKAGKPVTLIEKRPFAGGKTYSFTDPHTGVTLDNGQHVFMRCCTEYLAFLRDIGASDRARIQPALRVPVIGEHGRTSAIYVSRLPGPLALGPAFARYAHLSLGERARAGALLLRIKRMSAAERDALDGISFEDFLRARGQSARSIENFWDLVTIPTLNLPAGEASAAVALFVYKRGLLSGAHDADLGLPARGLTELHVAPALRRIEAFGGTIRLRTAAKQLLIEDGTASGVLTDDGERLDGDVILAVPHTEVAGLLPPEWAAHPSFEGLARLGVSPIVNLHLWYDRPVMDGEFTAFLHSPVQWVFNRSLLWGDTEEGQHLGVSLSAASREVAMSREELLAELVSELERLLPAARGATLRRAVVIKEPEATFAARPGTAALRPGPVTPIRGLRLAGAYVATGWPATMESAVRAGRMAAGVGG